MGTTESDPSDVRFLTDPQSQDFWIRYVREKKLPVELQERAAELLDIAETAWDDSRRYHENERHVHGFTYPILTIARDDLLNPEEIEEDAPEFSYIPEDNSIEISMRYLLLLASKPKGSIKRSFAFDLNGQPTILDFEGTIEDDLYLAIVEEVDHPVRTYEHPEEKAREQSDIQVIHNAELIEQLGLETLIIFAERKGLPEQAERYRQQLEEAKAYAQAYPEM